MERRAVVIVALEPRSAGQQVPDLDDAQARLEAWERFGTGAPYWRAHGQSWVRADGGEFADRCLVHFRSGG